MLPLNQFMKKANQAHVKGKANENKTIVKKFNIDTANVTSHKVNKNYDFYAVPVIPAQNTNQKESDFWSFLKDDEKDKLIQLVSQAIHH